MSYKYKGTDRNVTNSINALVSGVGYEGYDLVKHFVEVHSTFPHNTYVYGYQKGRGYISYSMLMKHLMDGGAEVLFMTSEYGYGVKKVFLKWNDLFINVENIVYRKPKAFKSVPADAKVDANRDGNIPVVLGMTILHKDVQLDSSIVKEFENFFLKIVVEPTIGLISRDQSGYYVNDIKLENNVSDELELHYGEGFEDFHNLLLTKLSTTNHGITLLHGAAGSGKSSYIKKLIYDLKAKTGKKVIFLQNNMINYILDPEFNNFLMEVSIDHQLDIEEFGEGVVSAAEPVDGEDSKEPEKGVILIIEDAENVLKSRDSQYGDNGTSTILNLTSGILNDIFGVQIIATYNTEDKNIDSAIMRSKRLMAKRYFDKLSVDSTKKLAEHLGIDTELVTGKEMTVADVYALLDKEEEDILIEGKRKEDIDKKNKKKKFL